MMKFWWHECISGREVLAIEAVEQNAMRLCHTVQQFDHASRVHVINNAVTSSEGDISLTSKRQQSTLFSVGEDDGDDNKDVNDKVTVYGIRAERLLEVIPWKRVTLKVCSL